MCMVTYSNHTTETMKSIFFSLNHKNLTQREDKLSCLLCWLLICLLPSQSTPLVWPSFYSRELLIQPGIANKQSCDSEAACSKTQSNHPAKHVQYTCNHTCTCSNSKTSVGNFQNNCGHSLQRYLISLKTREFVCRPCLFIILLVLYLCK